MSCVRINYSFILSGDGHPLKLFVAWLVADPVQKADFARTTHRQHLKGCIMKTRYVFLSMILTIALTLPVLGEGTNADTTRADMKKHDMSSMMGKPTVDATVEGLHVKVWLMSQKEHKEMMKPKPAMMMKQGEKEGEMGGMGMKDTSMGMGSDMKGMTHDRMEMDKATKDAMMAGTHHIGLEVTDAANGKAIANASVSLLIESPSKKTSSVDLKPMMSHFGGGLTLDEKGEYRFTVNVTAAGVSRTTKFQYAVE
jgi:hypothetical protein